MSVLTQRITLPRYHPVNNTRTQTVSHNKCLFCSLLSCLTFQGHWSLTRYQTGVKQQCVSYNLTDQATGSTFLHLSFWWAKKQTCYMQLSFTYQDQDLLENWHAMQFSLWYLTSTIHRVGVAELDAYLCGHTKRGTDRKTHRHKVCIELLRKYKS